MSVRIYYDNTSFRLKGWKKTRTIIEKIVGSKKKVSGALNFIITDDESIRKINIQFLKHDYFTDVITFESNNGNIVNGEVYISIDTVKINADLYKVSLQNEIRRVMIHGVLHLLGYDDKSGLERKNMRSMEDIWLRETEIFKNGL